VHRTSFLIIQDPMAGRKWSKQSQNVVKGSSGQWGGPVSLALLNYRASPLKNEKSPAEKLYGGRKIATRLHMVTQACLLNFKGGQPYKEAFMMMCHW